MDYYINVFLRCINPNYWHQILVGSPSMDNIANISSTVMVIHMLFIHFTKTKGKCSKLDRDVSHKGISAEFGKSKKKLHASHCKWIYSPPIFICVCYKHF